MDEVALILGCGGGGATKKTAVTTAGGERLGMINNNQEGFRCSECTFKAEKDVSVGDTCPGCGFTKADYAKKYGVVCD
jgi:rubrerythrin